MRRADSLRRHVSAMTLLTMATAARSKTGVTVSGMVAAVGEAKVL